MPGDVPHGSDGRPLPPAFTQRTSRGPEPAAGERPLTPPYFATDGSGFGPAAAPARPAPAQAAFAGGAVDADVGNEPWAASPDYEDAVGAAQVVETEARPIDDFLVPVVEPQPIPADDLVEVYDPVEALVRSVQLVDEAEQGEAEPIDADTLDYIEAVALGDDAPETLAASDVTAADPAAGVPPEVMAALFNAPQNEAPALQSPDELAVEAEPQPALPDISAEATRSATEAAAWPADVLAAIRAPGSDRPAPAAPTEGRAGEPAEIEPAIELQPVGFDALAEEILAGGRTASEAPAEVVDAAPAQQPAAEAQAVLEADAALEAEVVLVTEPAMEAAPVLEAESVLEVDAVLEAEAAVDADVVLATDAMAQADAMPQAAAALESDEGPGAETAAAPATAEVRPPSAAPARPTGADAAMLELAARLEAAARRLRESGAAGLAAELPTADRFDTVLIGLLTGFLAAHRG